MRDSLGSRTHGQSSHALLVLGPGRIQEERDRAARAAADAAAYDRQVLRLSIVCILDFLVGLAIIAFSAQMTNGDLARVVFYIGLIRALCVPMWTVLLSIWLEGNGWTSGCLTSA